MNDLPHQSRVFGSVLQHNDVANCDKHELDDTASTYALYSSTDEKHQKTLTCSAESRSQEENTDHEEKQGFSAHNILKSC